LIDKFRHVTTYVTTIVTSVSRYLSQQCHEGDMTMAKQWVRWYVEFLHDPKRTVLTVAEQGIWSLLLLLAGASSTQDGRLRVCDGVPYTPESLAAALGLRPEDAALVGPALEKFRQLRMIDIDKDGTIILLNYEKRQYDHPSDRPGATRARKARSRQLNKDVTSVSRECHEGCHDPCHDPGHEDVTSVSRPITEQNRVDQIRDIDLCFYNAREFQKLKGRPISPMELEQLREAEQIHGPELVTEAITMAFQQKKNPGISYILGILRNWAADGLKTVEAVREANSRANQKKGVTAHGRADPVAGGDKYAIPADFYWHDEGS
jgi:DnaD/phage-associated family protein